jgi:hypothetical protein
MLCQHVSNILTSNDTATIPIQVLEGSIEREVRSFGDASSETVAGFLCVEHYSEHVSYLISSVYVEVFSWRYMLSAGEELRPASDELGIFSTDGSHCMAEFGECNAGVRIQIISLKEQVSIIIVHPIHLQSPLQLLNQIPSLHIALGPRIQHPEQVEQVKVWLQSELYLARFQFTL